MPSGFVRYSASPGRAPDFGQIPSGATVPTTASPYFGSASRIVWPPARIAPAARTCSLGAVEDRAHHLRRQLLGQRGDRQREQRHAAHREHVVQRVRRGDRPEVVGVVDDRREEVDREDERALVVELVDRRVVGRVEPDEQVLGLGGHEAAQQLLEPRRRVLRRAASRGRQIGELHDRHRNDSGGRRGRRRQGRGTSYARSEFAPAAATPLRSRDAQRTRHRRLVGHRPRDRAHAARGGLRADARLAHRRRRSRRPPPSSARTRSPPTWARRRTASASSPSTSERFGGMDVLVNSAGHRDRRARSSRCRRSTSTCSSAINLRGLLLVTREAIPLLKRSKGWIVNLASIAGTTPTPGLTVYGATKAAVIALTRSHERRARRRRRARDRDLPRVRRHADGASGRASQPTR